MRGIAVHAAARILGVAQPNEVLVSTTVRDLLSGSGLVFADRGEFELRGLEGRRSLSALARRHWRQRRLPEEFGGNRPALVD